MPRFRPADGRESWFYVLRYSHLGRTPAGIAWFVVRHPVASLSHAFEPEKLKTVLVLLLGFGCAPLFGGRRLLAALPFALVHYLSGRASQFWYTSQYLAEIVPVMAWAAIAGAPYTFARWPRLSASVALLVGIGIGVAPRLFTAAYLPRSEQASLWRAVRLVPEDAPACATTWFGASLSGRRSFDYCVRFSPEIEQYAFYDWPQTSSAAYQVFDLDDSDTTPDAGRRVEVLRAAGAEVLLDENPVFVLRVTQQVLDRAAHTSN
jgi:Predicted membrane protein (DUF2079)